MSTAVKTKKYNTETYLKQRYERYSAEMTFKMHWENCISISFHIEWDMIVVTVFLSILNQMEVHLVQNRKENCHHDHIPFNMKGNGNIVFPAYLRAPLLNPSMRYCREFRGVSGPRERDASLSDSCAQDRCSFPPGSYVRRTDLKTRGKIHATNTIHCYINIYTQYIAINIYIKYNVIYKHKILFYIYIQYIVIYI